MMVVLMPNAVKMFILFQTYISSKNLEWDGSYVFWDKI